MRRITAVIMMVILMISGCSLKEEDSQSGGKLSVVTSFYAMYDFAKLIGGDKADVYNLSSGGEEPHDFEPSAADIVKIEKSDLFIYNGNHMEGWTEKVISSLKGNVSVVEASKDIEKNDSSDPHIWLSPKNAYMEMENICDAFCEKDSANAEYYRANLLECKKRTDELDKRYKDVLTEKKMIIVSHEAYGYLCSEYNMEQVPLSGLFDEGEASPLRIAEVIDIAKRNNIKCVYIENEESDKAAVAVAEGAGIETRILSPFESETQERNYFEVMEANLQALIN